MIVIPVVFVVKIVETGCCSSKIFEFNDDKSNGGTLLFVRWCFDECVWCECLGVVIIDELFKFEYVDNTWKALGNDWEKR